MTATYPVHRRDRPWRKLFINVIAGTFDMPSTDVLREAVARLAEAYPYSRLNWRLDETGRTWHADRTPETIVTEGVWPDGINTNQLLDSMCHDPALEPPLSLIRYPNHLGWRMSHSIGDGGAFPVILYAVMHTAITGEVADWPPQPTGRFPLLTAGVRTFGRHPSMIASAIRDRYQQDEIPESDSRRPWTPSRRSLGTVLSREKKEEMRAWADRSGTRTTDFSMLMCTVLRALSQAGIEAARDVNILVDLRGYLGQGWVDGNFIAGVPMRIVPEMSPQEISAAIRTTKKSGRPLANQMLTSSRVGDSVLPAISDVDPQQRPRLTFSQVVRNPYTESLPFLDTDWAAYTASIEPAGPHGITVLFIDIHGATTISATFHDNVIDPEIVDRALKLVSAEPLRLLPEA